MTGKLSCFIALSLTLLAGTFQTKPASPTPSFVRAPGQKFYLDLDAKEGSFSQWRHDELGSLTGLRATVSIPRVGRGPNFAAVFAFLLQESESTNNGQVLGLQLGVFDNKDSFVFRVVHAKDGKPIQVETLQKRVDLNEKVNIAIDWATPGTVSIKVGETEMHRLDVAWSIQSVAVTASTGEMKVDPLVFGRVEP
jgi:hypothetical protein